MQEGQISLKSSMDHSNYVGFINKPVIVIFKPCFMGEKMGREGAAGVEHAYVLITGNGMY